MYNVFNEILKGHRRIHALYSHLCVYVYVKEYHDVEFITSLD